MLSQNQVIKIVCLVIMISLMGRAAFAAGSSVYRVEAPDAHALGMGSAFVGQADIPAAIYYNPAGINQMRRAQMAVGDALIAPRAKMIQPNGNTVHEQNNEFNIPNIYLVLPLTSQLSVGYGAGSYFGLGTNWGNDSPLRYATTQASIKSMDNLVVVSYQATPRWSMAVSLDNDFSKANESRRFANGDGTDGNEQLRGSDNSWGYRIATMFKINDKNQVGLMYRSRMTHNYRGKAIVSGMSTGVQALYGFSGPNFITGASQKVTLPQSVVLGYSFKPTAQWTINTDVEWMDWSNTKNDTLRFANATASQLLFLNAGNPTPDNQHSAWSEAIGVQYDVTQRLRVRCGYYHHQKAIATADFNPKIPDSSSNGYTTGFGFDVTKRLTLDVAYSLIVYNVRNIANAVALSTAGVAGTVNGKYEQILHVGLVSLTYKF